jgi:transcriptional regulator GlxA family with amidase domain
MDRRIEVVISNMEDQPAKAWKTSELADLVNLSGTVSENNSAAESCCPA